MLSKAETLQFNVSFLVSMFHFKNTEGEKQKDNGSDYKTLWERSQNTEGAIAKHCGSVQPLPQCFEK